MKRWCVWLLVLAPLAACGGGQERPPASPASEPASDKSGQAPAQAAPGAPEHDGSPESVTAPAPTGTGQGGDKKAELRAQQREARRDLERAERDAQTGDCPGACRALASMERAAAHLCSLATAAGDSASDCDDAERRLKAARDRVRAACGTCPGGPSLDTTR